jgi:hypothetical protein
MRRLGVIFAAIQSGLKGMSYCSFLNKEKLSPSPSWVSDGCPKSYPKAYQAGEPWRKKIQDEKHRFTVKYRQSDASKRSDIIQRATGRTCC